MTVFIVMCWTEDDEAAVRSVHSTKEGAWASLRADGFLDVKSREGQEFIDNDESYMGTDCGSSGFRGADGLACNPGDGYPEFAVIVEREVDGTRS